MGRRSINTTKSGKYMNPTDQARKEARKLELKKNKKQRQMVRAAVLKGKDPYQILDELEKIDQMEFNVTQPSPLNEKVLKDKRKKLRDTLERVLNMYYRDDPDKWTDLKRKQADYEHKRNQIVSFYESVKTAQSVQVDEIPLPTNQQQNHASFLLPFSDVQQNHQIPLPPPHQQLAPINGHLNRQHVIYSIATALKLQALGQSIRESPGCPPGLPPNNVDRTADAAATENTTKRRRRSVAATTPTSSDDSDGDADVEDDDDHETDENDDEKAMPAMPSNKNKQPTSVQQKMVILSGQNVDDFMKEMEVTSQKKLDDDNDDVAEDARPPGTSSSDDAALSPIAAPPPPPTHHPPASFVFRLPPPPVVMTSTASRLPPPPLSNQQVRCCLLTNPSSTTPNGRIVAPPPPPPPPHPIASTSRLLRHTATFPLPPIAAAQQQQHFVTAAPPRLLSTNGGNVTLPTIDKNVPNRIGVIGGVATISAKPQIRNLSADVTRFVPTALRAKKNGGGGEDFGSSGSGFPNKRKIFLTTVAGISGGGFGGGIKRLGEKKQASKDDAYLQFMKEMQGLI